MDIALVGTLPEADVEAHKGPERTTIGLAEALSARGHDVTVVADEGSTATVKTDAVVLTPDYNPGIGRMLGFNYRIRQSVDLSTFDIVHAWRPIYYSDVLSLHSVGMAEEVESEFPGTFSVRWIAGAKIHRWAKTISAWFADQVVVTAPGNLIYAEKYDVPVDNIIPVGVESKFIQSDEYGSLDVVTVARVERRKQPVFVDNHTPERYNVTIVGKSNNETLAEQLSSRWVGQVSEDELLRCYREAGVFVFPSYFDGFGLTAAEAMAAGTPVVVSDECCIDDWVTRFDLGAVYEFGDSDSFESALETVLTNRNWYGQNAREFVESYLTWNRIAGCYEDLYTKTISNDESDTESWRRSSFPNGESMIS